MTGASPGARADHVACHHVNGVSGVCRRLTLAMRFCYTRRGFTTRSSSRSAFVSTTIVAFYLLAAFTVASALGVALSHNIVYSAFALMGTLLGVAGVFVLLGADFVGVVQLLVYVGGILVLILFAVMLTHRIADVRVSNRSVGRGAGARAGRRGAGRRWCGSALRATWVDTESPARRRRPRTASATPSSPTSSLPFELASLVLLVALIGAVVVSRKEVQGLMEDSRSAHFLVAERRGLLPRPLLRPHAPQRDRHPDGHRADPELGQHQLRRLRALRRDAATTVRSSRSSSSCWPRPRRRSGSPSCSASTRPSRPSTSTRPTALRG